MTFDAGAATALIALEKTLAPGEWIERDDGEMTLICDFEGDHSQVGRLKLKVRIAPSSIDKVSFTLLLSRPGYKQRYRIYALDLNAPRHVNPFKANDPDSLRIFASGESHEHYFADRIDDEGIARFARPIEPAPLNFEEAARYVCDRLHVTTPPDIPAPPAQGFLV